MDRDRLSLGVLCVLCGGAIEIPRLHAPAYPNLLRVFALNQTQSKGPSGTSFGPGLDGVWTEFFITFLPPNRYNPIPTHHFRPARLSQRFFSFAPRCAIPRNVCASR